MPASSINAPRNTPPGNPFRERTPGIAYHFLTISGTPASPPFRETFLLLFSSCSLPGPTLADQGKNSAHPLPPLPEGNIEKRTPYKTILSFPPEREWGIMTAHTNH